jgi:acetylcholinesterase
VNGASADPRYNLTWIVDQSVKENKPFVAVSINYRLSYWGFLFSEEMEAVGAGNIAFKDQRMAFKWVQDNVAAFGGSADKVTVWGESAGARSLGMQLIAYDGQFDGLFRSAIMESGSPVTKFVDAATWQPYFDAVVEKTGCANATNHLDCLRELPAQALNDVFNSTTPVNVTSPALSAVLDGDFITAQAPQLLAAGKFAHVPLLLGNNFDEGTAYGKKGLNTSEQFETYLSTQNLTKAQIDQIATLYPDDPDVGIPASYVGRPTDPAYGLQWKRAAAFAGDWQQHAGRRLLAESYAAADLSVYSYLWNVYVNGIPNILGATHFQELAFVFYDLTSAEFKNKPETFKELSNLMSRQWVNFINDANPNLSISPEGTPAWPLYTPAQPDNIVFDVNVTGLAYTAEDNYRSEAITYLQQNVYE